MREEKGVFIICLCNKMKFISIFIYITVVPLPPLLYCRQQMLPNAQFFFIIYFVSFSQQPLFITLKNITQHHMWIKFKHEMTSAICHAKNKFSHSSKLFLFYTNKYENKNTYKNFKEWVREWKIYLKWRALEKKVIKLNYLLKLLKKILYFNIIKEMKSLASNFNLIHIDLKML